MCFIKVFIDFSGLSKVDLLLWVACCLRNASAQEKSWTQQVTLVLLFSFLLIALRAYQQLDISRESSSCQTLKHIRRNMNPMGLQFKTGYKCLERCIEKFPKIILQDRFNSQINGSFTCATNNNQQMAPSER